MAGAGQDGARKEGFGGGGQWSKREQRESCLPSCFESDLLVRITTSQTPGSPPPPCALRNVLSEPKTPRADPWTSVFPSEACPLLHNTLICRTCAFLRPITYSYSTTNSPLPLRAYVCSVSVGNNTSGDLSESDLALLTRWLNPAYLKPESWSKVASAMEADGSVQLKQFLKPQVAAAIAAAARAQDKTEGVGGGKIPDFKAGYGPGEISRL